MVLYHYETRFQALRTISAGSETLGFRELLYVVCLRQRCNGTLS